MGLPKDKHGHDLRAGTYVRHTGKLAVDKFSESQYGIVLFENNIMYIQWGDGRKESFPTGTVPFLESMNNYFKGLDEESMELKAKVVSLRHHIKYLNSIADPLL